MNVFTVAFLGHRYMSDDFVVEKELEHCIGEIVKEKEYVEFLVGRNGDFDQLCASSVRRVKKSVRNDNTSLILVLPYMTADFLKNQDGYEEYYDEIEISENASGAHPKGAIQIRNREMVDRADLVLCYIERKSGGAYQSVKYALRKGKRVINLCHHFDISQ